jgi:signal transduction histidine kinase
MNTMNTMKSTTPTTRKAPAYWRRLFDAGESTVASTGLALAVVLICGMTLSAWLVRSSQEATMLATRKAYAARTADAIALMFEQALASDDLTLVRRLASTLPDQLGLEACQLRLPDGGVLADHTATAITINRLPTDWPAANMAPAALTMSGDRIRVSRPVQIAQRGQATLEIVLGGESNGHLLWQAQAAIGGVGAVTMLILLIVYRRLRQRIRAIGAIREALRALSDGETDENALHVSAALGREAAIWNQLLNEKAALRREQVRQRAVDRFEGADRGHGESLAEACNAMRLGMVITDSSLKVQYLNGSAAILLHTTVDHAIGSDVGTILGDDKMVTLIRETFTKRAGTSVQAELARNDQATDVIRADIRPVKFRGTNHVMIALEDITQLRLAEESRNAMIAQATHELRTPLTNIRMYVETAIEDGDRDPEVRGQCLNVINHEAARLERIVGDMLSVAEIEAAGIELVINDIRLDNLFAELENDYRAQANDRGLILKFDLIPKLPALRGDRDKLTLVFHNLLGNALKYTIHEGTITVRVDVTETDLLVDVSDTGIGIAPEDQERIFERFQRARDTRLDSIAGSGLGLALAHDVVHRHGGTLTVESKLNVGSTFHVTIPLNFGAESTS